MSKQKLEAVTDRLITKMKLSQTPIPGFIMGLSGTDSMVAFHICYRALMEFGMHDRLVGIHYVNGRRKKPTWFEEGVVPWMQEAYPGAQVLVEEPLGGNQDQQRWADLHFRALNYMDDRGVPHSLDRNYWTVGTINATEMYLGKYSILANSTSVQVIRNIWKSEIIDACNQMGVPRIAIETSMLPDCLCGRDEIAAENIHAIDAIIQHDGDRMPGDPALLCALVDYIRDTKMQNDFKLRTPFIP